jgi:hypothetical protein
MKNIKKVITAATLMMVLMVGTSFGGIILADAQQPQPCTAQPSTKSGIILSDLTGIILAQLTGIILADVKDTTTTNCGIILAQ